MRWLNDRHHVLRPIYARCVEGRCPYFDILPIQGAIPFKPCTWGVPRVSFTPFTIPWAEIPLPLQGAAAAKPPKDKQGVAASKPQNPASKPPNAKLECSR